MTGRLLHYSAKPIEFRRSYKYYRGGCYKPLGLWVSVEGEQDWRAWCESENYGSLACEHEVLLRPSAHLLRVSSVPQLTRLNTLLGAGPLGMNPNWDDVVRQYDGLIIAPYQWAKRCDYSWYYGWDCASGVIWNLRAVASVKPTAKLQAELPEGAVPVLKADEATGETGNDRPAAPFSESTA